MIAGYNIPFTRNARTGRWAVPCCMSGRGVPASVKHAKETSLRVKGCKLFNILPAVLRNADHGDLPMFKNNLLIGKTNMRIILILLGISTFSEKGLYLLYSLE